MGAKVSFAFSFKAHCFGISTLKLNFNYMTSNIHLMKSTILARRAAVGRKEGEEKEGFSITAVRQALTCLCPSAPALPGWG